MHIFKVIFNVLCLRLKWILNLLWSCSSCPISIYSEYLELFVSSTLLLKNINSFYYIFVANAWFVNVNKSMLSGSSYNTLPNTRVGLVVQFSHIEVSVNWHKYWNNQHGQHRKRNIQIPSISSVFYIKKQSKMSVSYPFQRIAMEMVVGAEEKVANFCLDSPREY